MRGRSTVGWTAGIAVAALALSACGGGDDGGGAGGAGATGSSGGSIIVGNCKPQHPLVPADTNEVCGGNVVDALFTGLVVYNPDTAEAEMAVAKSIESSDNVNWTIKLNDGWKFTDGTRVDAKSFVDAWNYDAYGPNAMQNAYFFEPIKGFTDVQGEDKNGDEKLTGSELPTTKTMSGLKVVDDTTFTVALTSPQSDLPLRLGYTAFAPLPQSFYDDPKGFGTKPVGNGPFKFDSGNGDVGYQLSAVPGYVGPDKPKVAKVNFKTYQSPEAEYTDLIAGSGNVDFVQQVPPSALAGDKWKSDLGDRSLNKPIGVIQTATFPLYDKRFQNVDLRHAISLAVNRPLITKTIYNNGRTPATGWTSPILNGYQPNGCGEWCTYDAAKAKQLLQQAGGWSGSLTFSYNADGAGNKEAADAICNSIKNALDISCTPKSYVDFSTFRTDITAFKMTGMFRTGWQMDYPSLQNFLVPLYATNAPSNDGKYSSKEFDSLMKQAAAATGDEANKLYFQGEQVLAKDMPVIPLWYQAQQSGWSTKLADVKITPFGTLDLASVTTTSS